ncbi:Type I restriction enzyme EcoKI specificity protein [uncultured Roseburia sp.]|uniref:Restriction endonuclease subunit S n=1 Tax=Brotonthovivens ammoniilytica TaxID=2981725 RepID=A0ABT2TLT1_9FIRM|nr:restriction endonuclease subunit S [Brotonthovivens ammoniilytica]MCU6763178.1 restriction endonuclease subunit S [Brotonthovivens ammoniilytica]SCJ05850.1 Type I restriction enzyme EcoKI specificity protein [uncultured Roseburia sp.]
MAKVKLGDICEIVSGSTPKTSINEYWDGDIDWITPAEINEDTYIVEESVRKITQLGVEKTGLKPFPKGTVILSSRAPIGKVAIAGKEMYCNQGFKNLICSDEVLSEYLYWFLRGNTVYLNSLGRGATFKEISKGIVADIEINLPDKKEQQMSVDMLKKVWYVIAVRRRELEQLDLLIKSRFVEMFGDPITNPKGWNKVEINDCLECIENGKSFVCAGIARVGTDPAILKLSAVTYGVYKPEENKAMIDENDFLESAEVQEGDLLFTRKNTPELVGMAAYVSSTPGKLMMPDLIFRLNTNENCNKVYLCNLINHDLFRGEIQSIASGSAKSMSNISKGRLGKLIICLPPIELQNNFSDFVNQVDKSKIAVQKSLDEVQLLFDSLMQKYFG